MRDLILCVIILAFIFLFGSACRMSGELPGAPPEGTNLDESAPSGLISPTNTPSATSTPVVTVVNSPTVETVFTDDSSTLEPKSQENPTPTQSALRITPDVTTQSEDQNTQMTELPDSELDDARLIFSDDFNTIGGWIPGSTENYVYGYAEDAYQFTIRIPGLSLWNVRSQAYPNTREEIEILGFEGSQDGFFGLICRWQRPNVYYMFTLANSGQITISKNFYGEISDLATKNISVSDLGFPIKLRADCSENGLWLYVNDEVQLYAIDTDLDEGQYGIIAGSGEQPPFSVSVDNFKLFVP